MPNGKYRQPLLSPDSSIIGGARQQSTGGRDARAYLWAGTIMHVDTETMVCSVRLDSGQGIRHDVPIPAPGGAGPRSWSGSIPEIGSKVVLGWKKFDNRGSYVPYIIEFLTPGVFPAREFEPFSSLDPDDAKAVGLLHPELSNEPGVNIGVTRLKARKGYPGDFIASSSSGSDILLDRDALLTNRAGNEFRLRDSDQTTILQTRNEFSSNAAGYYKRGLIKRNAFNFLPDLYPLDFSGNPVSVISPGDPKNGVDDDGAPLDRHPAYDILLDFGLIKENGAKNFDDDPDNPFYPYVVHPDGQRTSYVVPMEHDFSFNDTPFAYTEDRREIRHLSDGTMAVTEEGDGFQIDKPFPVFIEDVHGTVVGNDFHSESGRSLYKRILTMRVFSDVGEKSSSGPVFEPVDTVQRLHLMDEVALARLYRVQCPTNSNQYAFGVTKDGRVLIHVPRSQADDPQSRGRSVDMDVRGLIKAIIGRDPNSGNASIDARLEGGAKLSIGRLSTGESIKIELEGGINKIHHGDPSTGIAETNFIGGSILTSCSGSISNQVDGSIVQEAGSEHSTSAQKIVHAAGPGGLVQSVSGDLGVTVLGKTQEQYAQICNITHALGKITTHLTGADTTTMVAGAIARNVTAGAGIADSVIAGNITQTVATGNLVMSVGAGSMTATVGSGALALTASGGPASITSSLTATITASSLIALTAPVNKIGITTVGFAVAGVPGPPGPHLDYLLGIPILGIPNLMIG